MRYTAVHAMQVPAGFHSPSRRRFDVVAVAASAGGVQALRELLTPLPDDFPVPLLVVQHRASDAPGYLDQILARHTRLAVREVRDGERLRAGSVYVCPAGRHLGVAAGGILRTSDGPKDRSRRGRRRGRCRDSGPRRPRPGAGPATCLSPSMPRAVLTGCGADFVLPLEKLAHALVCLVMAPSVSAALFGIPAAA